MGSGFIALRCGCYNAASAVMHASTSSAILKAGRSSVLPLHCCTTSRRPRAPTGPAEGLE